MRFIYFFRRNGDTERLSIFLQVNEYVSERPGFRTCSTWATIICLSLYLQNFGYLGLHRPIKHRGCLQGASVHSGQEHFLDLNDTALAGFMDKSFLLPRHWTVVSGMVYGLVSVSIWPVATKTLIYHSQLSSPTQPQWSKRGVKGTKINSINTNIQEKYYKILWSLLVKDFPCLNILLPGKKGGKEEGNLSIFKLLLFW